MYQFSSLTVLGELEVKGWAGGGGDAEGGYMLVMVAGVAEISGTVSVSGCGYRGGQVAATAQTGVAWQGESSNDNSSQLKTANFGGGGGGEGSGNFGSSGGGGGGYGAAGSPSEPNTYEGGNHPGGVGGEVYGDAQLTTLHLGSGGGSGHPYSSTGGKTGGCGGGCLVLAARTINNSGTISADGHCAPSVEGARCVSGGGGGSGGSMWLIADSLVSTGRVTAEGGTGAEKGDKAGIYTSSGGGNGGKGRVRVDIIGGDSAQAVRSIGAGTYCGAENDIGMLSEAQLLRRCHRK